MRNLRLGLVGLALFVFSIALFILVVPAVKTTDLGLREYLWAIVIIFSTCIGFGLCMITILDGEELSTSDFPSGQEKRSSRK